MIRKTYGTILLDSGAEESLRKAQTAFSGVAEEMGVYNEEDVQSLVDEIRYGKGKELCEF